jgi:RHS repeat-associated protein
MAGAGRLAVTTVASQDSGTEWSLDGTFVQGHLYKARVWVNAASGTTVTAKLGVAADATTGTLPTTVGNGTWKALDVTWTPTAPRTGVRLAVYRAATSGSVTFYLDDAVVWDSTAGFTDVNIPTETAYDLDGRVVASVVAPGTVGGTDEPMVTRTAYDALGRPTSVTVNEIAGGGTSATDVNLATLTAYDALGRTQSTTDPTGTVTRYDYDRLGRVTTTWLNYVDGTGTSATSDDDVASTYAYNAAGELTGYCPAAQEFTGTCDPAVAANLQAWHYAYDAGGHLVRQTPPDNTTALDLADTIWTYDAGGRLTESCELGRSTASCAAASGVVRTIVPTYDDLGRATRTDIRSGSASGTLALRSETDFYGDGQVKETRAYQGATPTLLDTITQTYDAFGRPDQVKRGTTVLSDNEYNADDTLASRADGDGGDVGTSHFDYDWAQRLTEVTVPSGFAASTTATFGWRLDGLIASRTWASGSSSAAFTYDRAKRPTRIDKGTIWISQAYDRDGNVTSEARSFPGVSGDPGTGTQTFTYDALNRVTASSGLSTAANRAYTYDRDGNRLTKVEGGVTTFNAEYDRTDELIKVDKGAGWQFFSYDALGSMTGDAQTATGVTAYTYDLANKLTGIDAAGTANDATFTFDAFGRFRTRVVASGSGTDTYSYLGTSETVVRIANSVAGVTDSIVSPAGDRLGVKVGTTVNWFLPDLHGDIAGSLTADETTLANAIRYDPYGETLATGSAGGTAVGEEAWKYQGRLDIAPEGLDTPLYDMSARFYAPGIGAFTQLDTYAGTAQNPLSMNRFLYVEGNPWTLTDPTGHCAALLAWAGGPETGIPATAFCGLLLLAGAVEFALVADQVCNSGPFGGSSCSMPDIKFQGPSVPQTKVEPAFPEPRAEWRSESRRDPSLHGNEWKPPVDDSFERDEWNRQWQQRANKPGGSQRPGDQPILDCSSRPVLCASVLVGLAATRVVLSVAQDSQGDQIIPHPVFKPIPTPTTKKPWPTVGPAVSGSPPPKPRQVAPQSSPALSLYWRVHQAVL